MSGDCFHVHRLKPLHERHQLARGIVDFDILFRLGEDTRLSLAQHDSFHNPPLFLSLTLLAPTLRSQSPRSPPTSSAAPLDAGGSAPHGRELPAHNSGVPRASTSEEPNPSANYGCIDNPPRGRVAPRPDSVYRANVSAPAAFDRNAHPRAPERWPRSRRSISARWPNT